MPDGGESSILPPRNKAGEKPETDEIPPTMSQTETLAVLEANAAFYRAMREGDFAAMDRVWAHHRTVSCTHPNRPAIFGREAVMESWRIILVVYEPPMIRPVKPKAIVTGETAMILCREDLGHVELMASNSFVREDGKWRMLNHQACHIPGTEQV